MWVGAAEHVAGKTNKAGSSWDMQPWKLQETSLDLLPSGGGRHSPCPSQEGRHWALSDVMCPGWLGLYLIYVWGQTLTHSPSLPNLNVHSKGLSLSQSLPSICLWVSLSVSYQSATLSFCLSVCLPAGLSGFRVCPYVCLAVCRSGLLACQKVSLPSHCMDAWTHTSHWPCPGNLIIQHSWMLVCACTHRCAYRSANSDPCTQTKGVPPNYGKKFFFLFFL